MPQTVPAAFDRGWHAFARPVIPVALIEPSACPHGYCRECLGSLNPRLLALHLHTKQLEILHKTEAHDSPYGNHV